MRGDGWRVEGGGRGKAKCECENGNHSLVNPEVVVVVVGRGLTVVYTSWRVFEEVWGVWRWVYLAHYLPK